MHDNQYIIHTCTPRVIPLVAFQNGPCLHVEYLWKNKTNQNDHKSLDDAFKSCLNMIKSLKGKVAKDPWHHCNHGLNDDPRPSR